MPAIKLPDQQVFQSRAGFSECLDDLDDDDTISVRQFQSRAGFSECLDVWTTTTLFDGIEAKDLFQSRAGFSECLDWWSNNVMRLWIEFQSRAGFSECLDRG